MYNQLVDVADEDKGQEEKTICSKLSIWSRLIFVILLVIDVIERVSVSLQDKLFSCTHGRDDIFNESR